MEGSLYLGDFGSPWQAESRAVCVCLALTSVDHGEFTVEMFECFYNLQRQSQSQSQLAAPPGGGNDSWLHPLSCLEGRKNTTPMSPAPCQQPGVLVGTQGPSWGLQDSNEKGKELQEPHLTLSHPSTMCMDGHIYGL